MYISNNQQQLRAECYQGIVESLSQHNIGRRIIVGATIIHETKVPGFQGSGWKICKT